MGTGFLYSCGILGSFFSSIVIYISEELNINPYFGIGFFGLLGSSGVLMSKETIGKRLEDSISEVENKNESKEI